MPNNPSVADDIGAVPMDGVLFCFCDEITTVDYASNDCFRADITNKKVNTSYGRYVFFRKHCYSAAETNAFIFMFTHFQVSTMCFCLKEISTERKCNVFLSCIDNSQESCSASC